MVSQEVIEQFLLGEDPEKYIVALEYDYRSGKVFKVIQDPIQGKQIKQDTFIPFAWVGDLHGKKFYGGSKAAQKQAMSTHGILIEKLDTHGDERMEEGLKYMVKTTKSYSNLVNFFKGGGLDPWERGNSEHIMIMSPVEQYLCQKGKRLFKGFNEYDEVHRFVFDIETTGLSPEESRIFLIGMKDNKGFEKVIAANNDEEERQLIIEFFKIVNQLKPSLIGGYNSAFFDFPFLIRRAEILGLDPKKIIRTLNPEVKFRQKDSMLKLANEMEDFIQMQMWGYNVVDIAHAVRRAQAINSDIKSWGLKYITQFIGAGKENRVYVQGDKIGKTYFDNKDYYFNPKTGGFKEVGSKGTENLMEKFPGHYEKVNGKYIVERYLYDDIWETMIVDEEFNQANFLLAKLVPTTYERLSTMGTATLWKMIMSSWSYKHGLAIPKKGEKRPFTGGLSRLLAVGYSTNVLKLDYSSLYPSIQLVHDVFPKCDVTGAMKSMLKYFRDTRIKYKKLAADYSKTDPKLSSQYNRKQLPIKIFINAFFGSLSAPHVFPWGDMDMGEQITCTGRQYLRQMIMWFMERDYKPLVMDTDGVNFSVPEGKEKHSYVGIGLNGLVEKGKTYYGSEADVAEYNDIFMRNEMGLDTDGQWPATINIARKNYALLTDKGKVKLTGNTIKSKKLPTYVAEFLDKSLRMLLDGKGHEFLDCYYEYVDTIYNKKIPISKIANKSRVKQSIEDYKKHITKRTKSGSFMSRQAHMELAIKHNLPIGLGDTIYYVNNGERKSHGDVQKKKDEVVLNCYHIDGDYITESPDMLGEYNVARYLAAFNKRIEPLLVVFSPEIRPDILIEDPADQPFFTKTQSELVRGFPRREGDQDMLEEVLTLSDTEVVFWKKVGIDPYYMYVDSTVDLVDTDYVKKNGDIMLGLEVENVRNEEKPYIAEKKKIVRKTVATNQQSLFI